MASEAEPTPTAEEQMDDVSPTMEPKSTNDYRLEEGEEETYGGVGATEEAEQEESELACTPLGSDNSEDARNYKEYKRLVKEIQYQNEIITNLKAEVQAVKCKNQPCSSKGKSDLKSLYECLELEMKKSRDLVKKAIKLQNFGSKRHYKEIDLVPTFDDDMEPIAFTCANMQVQSQSQRARSSQNGRCPHCRASGGETTSEMDRTCSSADMGENEEEQLMKEILAVLQSCVCCDKKPCKKKQRPQKCDSMEKVKQKIGRIEESMSKLKGELCRRMESKSRHDTKMPCKNEIPSCLPPKSQELKQLKDNYMALLTELSTKDTEVKDLTKKLKNCCGSGANDADTAEILLLTSRINELKEEQVEFKCLMREQSTQLEDYRAKYISAQQKVEEQCALIEKLNMNNKRIEKQINLEIKEIRCKFQEKLKELLQYPKLLENEQLKVAKMCKAKDDIEKKLTVVCKELRTLQTKLDQQANTGEGCKPQLAKCEQELSCSQKHLEEAQRQRDLFCEQLKAAQDDVDCLRSESAKIIARLKERHECTRKHMQNQINRLEKQLAQCRATACLSVSDRECVIREMQGQLNTLSFSFDAAQKQIKTLRNHIAYMSNENCFPSKC